MTKLGRIAALALLASALGCTENAILDVTLTVPATPAAARVELETRPASGYDFESEWAPTSRYPAYDFPLSGAAPTAAGLQIVAEDDAEGVLLRARFCAASGCDETTPTLCYEIERPFHIGQVSAFKSTLSDLPAPRPLGQPCSGEPRLVGACEIGCADGEWSDGADFCEGTSHSCDR